MNFSLLIIFIVDSIENKFTPGLWCKPFLLTSYLHIILYQQAFVNCFLLIFVTFCGNFLQHFFQTVHSFFCLHQCNTAMIQAFNKLTYQVRIKLSACILKKLLPCYFNRKCFFITSFGCHGIKRICHAQNPRSQWNIFSCDPARISFPSYRS